MESDVHANGEPIATESAAEMGSAAESELAAEKARADESYKKYLYAIAELENYKKRAERQLTDRLVAGKKATLHKFLPVIDNLERALSYDQDSEGLRNGLQATLRGFEAVLAAESVKPLYVLGQPFDPRFAQAIGTREADDARDDIVIEEVQKGYALGDELLRPAQVIVAKARGATE